MTDRVRAIYNPARGILRVQVPGATARDILRDERDPDFPGAVREIGWNGMTLALIIHGAELRVLRQVRIVDGRWYSDFDTHADALSFLRRFEPEELAHMHLEELKGAKRIIGGDQILDFLREQD
jgi:hypothetical protein